MADLSPRSSKLQTRSTDFYCEEERVRRLAERIKRDSAPTSELAREERARGLARDLQACGITNSGEADCFRSVSSKVASASALRRAAELEQEFEDSDVAAHENELPHQEREIISLEEIPETVSSPSQPRGLEASDKCSHARDDARPLQPTGIAASQADNLQDSRPALSMNCCAGISAREVSLTQLDPKERLNQALEDITVRGLVSLRSVEDAPDEVIATCAAVLRLLREDGRGGPAAELPAEPAWSDVMSAMCKPGHFVNALRRYPYAADRGLVSEDALGDVEEILAEVPHDGQTLAETNPVVLHLFTWVRTALEYAAWSHTCIENVASPVRAGALNAGRPVVTATAPKQDWKPQTSSFHDEYVREGYIASPLPVQRQDMCRREMDPSANKGIVQAAVSPCYRSAQPSMPSQSACDSSFVQSQCDIGSDAYDAALTSKAHLLWNQSDCYTSAKSQKSQHENLNSGPLTAKEAEEYQRKLEDTKREVREIKALESQVQWELERQEKKEVELTKKEADQEIMQWREEQAAGMREYAEEKARLQRLEDLQASKEYQEFKRDWKQELKQEELQNIKDDYDTAKEYSELQANIAKMAVVDRHAMALESLEDLQDQKELAAVQKLQECEIAEQERANEARLRYHHEANKLAAEKEELMRSLQMLRQKQKLPVTSNRGLTSAGRKR